MPQAVVKGDGLLWPGFVKAAQLTQKVAFICKLGPLGVRLLPRIACFAEDAGRKRIKVRLCMGCCRNIRIFFSQRDQLLTLLSRAKITLKGPPEGVGL